LWNFNIVMNNFLNLHRSWNFSNDFNYLFNDNFIIDYFLLIFRNFNQFIYNLFNDLFDLDVDVL